MKWKKKQENINKNRCLYYKLDEILKSVNYKGCIFFENQELVGMV